MLCQHWNDDRRIFRALALVDGYSVGRHQRVKLTEAVGDGTPIEAGTVRATTISWPGFRHVLHGTSMSHLHTSSARRSKSTVPSAVLTCLSNQAPNASPWTALNLARRSSFVIGTERS